MRSVRTRLTLTHAAAALIAIAIVAVLATILIQRGFDRLAVAQGREVAVRIAAILEAIHAERGTLRGAPQEIERLLGAAGEQLPRRLIFAGPNGFVLYDSRVGIGSLRGRRVPIAWRDQQAPVRDGDQVLGYVVVPFSGDQSDLSQYERDFLARVYISVILGSLLAGVIAFSVGAGFAARLTGALRRLTEAARRLAAGERHTPLVVPQERELAELAEAFNTMAADLERQQELRRQLTADIAHELRTPISVLRLQLESIEDGIETPTPALLGSLNEEVGLLARLVDDLRLLSLADAGQLSLSLAGVNVADALQQATTGAGERARRGGIDLRAEASPEPLIVHADPQRLAQILRNLIENAIRYTPAGGVVTVRAMRAATGAEVVLAVADTGPGIAPDDAARIFDRFYRTDRARARETGGSGLGLAIVQRLAEMHGGRVWLESTVGAGSTFFVALPEFARKKPSAPSPQLG
jgi:signal transduction histidine kinase